MRFINYLVTLLIIAACYIPAAHANIDNAQIGPRVVVEHATNRVIDVLKKEGDVIRDDPKSIFRLVNEHILPYFDFDKMSYFILGEAWKTASDQQKDDFQREFKHLLITTYSTALSEFSVDAEVLYKDVMVSPKNENVAIVPTEIKQKESGPIAVVYRMYRSEGVVWRIYDVAIDGVSLVKNYRANFASQVRTEGLDGLISAMSEHNQPEDSAVTIQKASQVQ